jgi:uncharacterized protein (TIGR00369 family)
MWRLPFKGAQAMCEHYRNLERMYLSAPVNELYSPRIEIEEGRAVVEFEVGKRFFHAAGAVHGAVYFKALDDSAFFAASSLVPDRFVVTVSFNLYFTRPVSDGTLRAEGRVVGRSKSLLIAESVLFNGDREVARGSGTFVPSRTELSEDLGYVS